MKEKTGKERTGKKKLKGVIRCILLACIIMAALNIKNQAQEDISEQAEKNGRVLFISSYSYGWNTVQLQIEGIKEGIGDNIVVDYEFMDTKRVNDETSNQQFYEGLKYRMSKVEPYDVIIVGDDAAFNFALEYQEELFKDIPIVFEGVNDVELAIEKAKEPLITGVVEQLSFEKNIDFALSMFPEAENVVAILDDTITGRAERKSYYENAKKYPDLNFTEINCSELTTSQLIEELSEVKNNTILIYIAMSEDASGRQYTSYQSISMIAEYSNVPAFQMVLGGVGFGILGGNMVSMELSGKIAAEMATDIINGKNPADISVVTDSPNIYSVDEDVMRKFDIDLSLIPEGAEVINHKASLMEKHKEVLIPLLVILALLIVIAVIVTVDNIRKRRITNELEKAKEHLQYTSSHDALTGLKNRTSFNEEFPKLLEKKEPCAVIMIDVDNFKTINDTFGHNIGDEALKQIGVRLITIDSDEFVPYRFAGDEFIAIVKSGDKETVEKCAAKCLGVFEKSFRLNDELFDIHGSIGVAMYQKGDTMLDLIGYADDAMYKVKTSGKNAYGFYERY